MHLKASIIGYVLLMIIGIADARVYKWIDTAGQTHYSDQPAANAQEIHLNVPQVSSVATPDTSLLPYNFELVQPEDNQTINTNNGEVVISVLLEPSLISGHFIRFALNNNLDSVNFTQTQIILRPVPLGTHKIYVAIVDDTGKILMQSKTVTFHVRKEIESTLNAQPLE